LCNELGRGKGEERSSGGDLPDPRLPQTREKKGGRTPDARICLSMYRGKRERSGVLSSRGGGEESTTGTFYPDQEKKRKRTRIVK